jgi:hypothetical protein
MAEKNAALKNRTAFSLAMLEKSRQESTKADIKTW